ncbi:uncharacterized protein LOC135394669 [Ornithodoros turicata]|uniref:uncharacterized protein LOC135394669 n=1 Tax=Ornithodoros turicata TaxID=34597 RepID=UPI003138CC24
MRIVFDASSHSDKDTSLNDHLENGPKVQPDLLDILLRFRTHPIGIAADIEKAFLQISVHEEDRDALRFLWFEEVPSRMDSQGARMVEWRMTYVPFGTTASPFLLTATLHHHFMTIDGELRSAANTLSTSFYVDDLLTGAATFESALELYEDSNVIMDRATMCLRKWSSNSCGFKKYSLRINETSARIYNPLGLLNPFTVRAKMLFQSLWVEQIGWDEEMPPDKQRLWQDWCEEVSELSNVTVDRCLRPCGAEDLQVHIFFDGSPKCYGAVAYLRAEKSGSVTFTLIFSKSRVAPIKQMTLPRLELMDSTIVLWWFRKPPSECKQFVSSRVQGVQQNTDTKRWKHCPGATNPEDCLTRGIPARTLSEKSTWWCGQHWLINDPTTWPANDIEWDMKADEERSLKATVLQISSSPSPLLNVESFSTCRRLLRVTAWVLRFVGNTRRSTSLSYSWLTAEELRRAQLYWEKQARSESYAEEQSRLKERRPVSLQSKIASLRPYLDD